MIAVLVWFVVCSNSYNYALLSLSMWSGWVLVYWFLLSEIETSFVDSTHTHTYIYIYMRIGPILLWPQRWVADTHPPRNKVSTHIMCAHCVTSRLLTLNGWCMGADDPSLGEQRTRPGHWLDSALWVLFSALTLLFGWQEGQPARKKSVLIIPRSSFTEHMEKENQVDQPTLENGYENGGKW